MNLQIVAQDGFQLATSLWEAAPGAPLVVIHSATGVRRQFYIPLARYFHENGFHVLTYDYRGIGESRLHQSLAGFNCSMKDWAVLDAQSVMNWVYTRYSGSRIHVIGHSFGGQCLGLLEGNSKISSVVTIGAQSGNWRNFPVRRWPFLLSVWYVLIPVLVRVMGYFPSKKLGLGEDLPGGVALQWAKWCRQKNYFYAEFGPELPNRFLEITGPLRVYSIEDDDFAPQKAVQELLPFLPQQKLELVRISPKNYDVPEIGHFGLFRDKFKNKFWPDLVKFFSSV